MSFIYLKSFLFCFLSFILEINIIVGRWPIFGICLLMAKIHPYLLEQNLPLVIGSKFIIYPFLFGLIFYLPLFYWVKLKNFPLFYWVKIHNLTIFIGSIFKTPLFLGWWSKFTPFYWTKIKISPFLLGQYLVNVARFARELSISL